MRRGLEQLGRAFALFVAGTVGGKAAEGQERPGLTHPPEVTSTDTPHAYKREQLPAVLDTQLRNLTPEQRARLLPLALEELERVLPIDTKNADFIRELILHPRPELDLPIFETARLSGNVVRNKLLRPAGNDALNHEQIDSFSKEHGKLEAAGYASAPYEVLLAWVNNRVKKPSGQEELFNHYTRLRAILENQVSADHEASAKDIKDPFEAAPPAAKPAPAPEVVAAPQPEVGPKPPRGEKMYFYADVKKTPDGKRCYYLTFDDGPDPEKTRVILRKLKKYNAKATFFVKGTMVERNGKSGILQEILADGHEIGIHSYDHTNFNTLASQPPEKVYHDHVDRVNELLVKNGVPPSRIFRAPYGNMTKQQLAYFAARGIYVIHWSKVADEYKHTPAKQIVKMMTDRAMGGNIGLLHDVGVDDAETAAAVEPILATLQSKDFAFGTISQGMRLKPFAGSRQNPTVAPEPSPARETPPPPPAPEATPASTHPEDTPTSPSATPDAGTADGGEKEQMPPNAFAKDSNGTFVGWNLRGHQYFTEGNAPVFTDLSQPIEGRNKDGSPTQVRLREGPYNAYIALQRDFEKSAPADARAFGFFVNEGYRSPADQAKLKRLYGSLAADSGKSKHEMGMAIDVYAGKYRAIYNWLFEPEHCLRDPHYIPRAVRLKLVPTVPDEPWHVEYAPGEMPDGTPIAEAYWKKYSKRILNKHTRLLQEPAPATPGAPNGRR